jgi:hypothetical protein
VRDPIFIPTCARVADTGFFDADLLLSAQPQGTSVEQVPDGGDLYRFHNGGVPARSPGTAFVAPWIVADHVISPDAGEVVEDVSPLEAGEPYHELDASAITIAADNELMGYTLLSATKNP